MCSKQRWLTVSHITSSCHAHDVREEWRPHRPLKLEHRTRNVLDWMIQLPEICHPVKPPSMTGRYACGGWRHRKGWFYVCLQCQLLELLLLAFPTGAIHECRCCELNCSPFHARLTLLTAVCDSRISQISSSLTSHKKKIELVDDIFLTRTDIEIVDGIILQQAACLQGFGDRDGRTCCRVVQEYRTIRHRITYIARRYHRLATASYIAVFPGWGRHWEEYCCGIAARVCWIYHFPLPQEYDKEFYLNEGFWCFLPMLRLRNGWRVDTTIPSWCCCLVALCCIYVLMCVCILFVRIIQHCDCHRFASKIQHQIRKPLFFISLTRNIARIEAFYVH